MMTFMFAVLDLIYWRDLKKTGVVFGSMLFILLFVTLVTFIFAVLDLIYWRDLKKTGMVFGSMLFILLLVTLITFIIAVLDLIYWRDLKKTGVVFGSMLFILLFVTLTFYDDLYLCSPWPDLLERPEEDWRGVWLYAVYPPFPGYILSPLCAGVPIFGCPDCDPQLQGVQECTTGCAEVRRRPPIQVSDILSAYVPVLGIPGHDPRFQGLCKGNRSTRPMDNLACGQLGSYVPDNSARRYNYTECLLREYKIIHYFLVMILSCLLSKSFNLLDFYAPFEEGGAYCVAHVGRSVCR